MSDFNQFVKEQLARKEVSQEYFRLAPFYRLADQLILLRKKRGMSQQELAAKAQTTQAVVSRLENVAVHCSLESVVRLAEALDAVVEVHLTPAEELQASEDLSMDTEQTFGKAPCEDENSAIKGIVYFKQMSKKPCPELLWSSFDPLTKRVYNSEETKKRKIMEIA
jgi:transcriptional regulator with XRE-family HTH domain